MFKGVLRAVLALFVSSAFGLVPAPAQPVASAVQGELPPPTDDQAAAPTPDNLDNLLDMDIEQLGRVDVTSPMMSEEVTSVSRQPSTVGKSPAAVFVITPEMIRRSGANNIPDVLRM